VKDKRKRGKFHEIIQIAKVGKSFRLFELRWTIEIIQLNRFSINLPLGLCILNDIHERKIWDQRARAEALKVKKMSQFTPACS
jgi:hypothetical protein